MKPVIPRLTYKTVANADNLYKIVNGYNGALIPLAGLAYNSVTIVKGPSAPSTPTR